MAPPLTPGQKKVLEAVIQHVRAEGMKAEQHLPEWSLARLLGTSRSPIRVVLDHLKEEGVTRYDRNKGYFLAVDATDIVPGLLTSAVREEDPVYLQIANGRFEGKWPDAVTEADLVRLTGGTRSEVRKALTRAEDEGWVEKAAGYGWEFLPTVNTLDAYADLYAVRQALEPACVLSPKFRPVRAQLKALLEEQRHIAEHGAADLSPMDLFESNARLHSTICEWSGNVVAIQILRRLDKVRRLAEYRQAVRPLPRQDLAREHCEVLLAIEAGDTLTAASLLRAHIDGARRQKVTSTAFGAPGAGADATT